MKIKMQHAREGDPSDCRKNHEPHADGQTVYTLDIAIQKERDQQASGDRNSFFLPPIQIARKKLEILRKADGAGGNGERREERWFAR